MKQPSSQYVLFCTFYGISCNCATWLRMAIKPTHCQPICRHWWFFSHILLFLKKTKNRSIETNKLVHCNELLLIIMATVPYKRLCSRRDLNLGPSMASYLNLDVAIDRSATTAGLTSWVISCKTILNMFNSECNR